jgi:hypothetical protein
MNRIPPVRTEEFRPQDLPEKIRPARNEPARERGKKGLLSAASLSSFPRHSGSHCLTAFDSSEPAPIHPVLLFQVADPRFNGRTAFHPPLFTPGR